MKNTIKNLDWDSAFFNIKVGEIIVNNKTLDIPKKVYSAYDLLYIYSENENDFKLEGYNNSYKETKVIFSKQLEKSIFHRNENITVFNEVNQIEVLYNLAYESGKMSRFKLDKTFTDEAFKSLYQKWIDNSVNSIIADGILVYKIKNRIVGFVTYSTKGIIPKIGLIAVDKNFQGQGIGFKLICEVESILNLKGFKQLNIATQLENITACKFYKRLDYEIIAKQIINHFWKL